MGLSAGTWAFWLLLLIDRCIMMPYFLLQSMRRSKKLPPIHDKLLLHSATTLAAMIRTRQVTSEEVVRAYISRIRDVNPLVNCMMDSGFQAALLDAQHVDRMVQEMNRSEEEIARETPFLGVPLSVKGSIAVKGLKYNAGQLRFENRRAEEDAETVKLLRASGAIPLVMTSTPELCMLTETYNNIIGKTNNPYDLRRTPGGSSGGEAALLASAGSVIGLGSDICGSLRIPAAFTGIFAHKPTPGVVSHAGHNPTSEDENWSRLFTIGPMSRYAEDLAPMLKVLSDKHAHRLKLDEKINIRDIKLYYMEDDGGSPVTVSVSREINEGMHKVIQYMESAHGIKAKKVNIKEMKNAFEISCPLLLQLNGVSSVHAPDNHPQPWKNIILDLLKFCTRLSEKTLPVLCYAIVKKLSVSLSGRRLEKLKGKRETLMKEFHELLGNDGVFLYPTFVDCAGYHFEMFYKLCNTAYTFIMNALQVPVTNCPVGMNGKGLPIGIQVVAAPFQDRLSIAVANELQTAFGGWTQPPTSENFAR